MTHSESPRLLDIANKNCERLVRMVNDVLDIDKIESGEMRFDMQLQPLRPLVEQAMQSTQGYAMQFNVKLELNCEAPGIQVKADSDRIVRVLVNLLSNAIKYSPAGRAVDVRIRSDAGHARGSVADHGSGIREEFRDRIFQEFAQVDSTDSRQKGGTGLGLSTCKCVLEEHGGSIDFRSEAAAARSFMSPFRTSPMPCTSDTNNPNTR